MDEEKAKLGTKASIFIFAFMFLYLALSFLGASVDFAVFVSIIFIVIIYGFMEMNWGKHLATLLKKKDPTPFSANKKIIDVEAKEIESKRSSE